jgi:hypothetical protein
MEVDGIVEALSVSITPLPTYGRGVVILGDDAR